MENVLTWTQFATVMGMLTALSGITLSMAAYFFKRWQEAMFGQLYGRLDGIDRRLDGIDRRLDGIDRRLDGLEARMVTKDELRAAVAELALRVRGERRPEADEGE